MDANTMSAIGTGVATATAVAATAVFWAKGKARLIREGYKVQQPELGFSDRQTIVDVKYRVLSLAHVNAGIVLTVQKPTGEVQSVTVATGDAGDFPDILQTFARLAVGE